MIYIPLVNLLFSIVKEAPPNEKININMLFKKYNMNIKKLKSNILVKRTNMFNVRSNCISECTVA